MQRSAVRKALVKFLGAACLVAFVAISFVSISPTTALAQSWHYQNCLRAMCVPNYWACRNTTAYGICSSAYTSCQSVCWGQHLMGRGAEVAAITERNRRWRNWNWANRPYRQGYGGRVSYGHGYGVGSGRVHGGGRVYGGGRGSGRAYGGSSGSSGRTYGGRGSGRR